MHGGVCLDESLLEQGVCESDQNIYYSLCILSLFSRESPGGRFYKSKWESFKR
jgi:hypothetical protein